MPNPLRHIVFQLIIYLAANFEPKIVKRIPPTADSVLNSALKHITYATLAKTAKQKNEIFLTVETVFGSGF